MVMRPSFGFEGYPGHEIHLIRGLSDCVRPDCPLRAALRIFRVWANTQGAAKAGAEPENAS
jgi:hypothetical protein